MGSSAVARIPEGFEVVATAPPTVPEGFDIISTPAIPDGFDVVSTPPAGPPVAQWPGIAESFLGSGVAPEPQEAPRFPTRRLESPGVDIYGPQDVWASQPVSGPQTGRVPRDLFDRALAEAQPIPGVTRPAAATQTQGPTWRAEVDNALTRGGLRTVASGPGTLGAIGKKIARHPITRMIYPREAQATDLPALSEKAGSAQDLAKLIYDEAQMESLRPRKEGVWGYIANTTFETLPLMAAATAAGATTGGLGAWAVGAMAEGEAAYQEAINAGASEDLAQTERLIVGTINGFIERMQADEALKIGKGISRESLRAIKQAARDRAMGKLGREVGKASLGQVGKAVNEGLEEALQETVSIGAATMHGDRIELGKDVSRVGQAGLGGLTAGGLLGLAGSVGQTAVETATQKAETTPPETGPKTDVAAPKPPEIGPGGAGLQIKTQLETQPLRGAEGMRDEYGVQTVEAQNLQAALAEAAKPEAPAPPVAQETTEKAEPPQEVQPKADDVQVEEGEVQVGKPDFKESFPTPSEAMTREGAPGQHYPDPKDIEQVRYSHEEWKNELQGYDSSIAHAKSLLEDIEKTGVNPETGRKLTAKQRERMPDQLRSEIARTTDQIAGLLGEYENIYGEEARKAFAQWAGVEVLDKAGLAPPAAEQAKKKPAKTGEGQQQFQNILKVSADTPEQLRAADTYRVLDEANQQGVMDKFYQWLTKQDIQPRTRERLVADYAELGGTQEAAPGPDLPAYERTTTRGETDDLTKQEDEALQKFKESEAEAQKARTGMKRSKTGSVNYQKRSRQYVDAKANAESWRKKYQSIQKRRNKAQLEDAYENPNSEAQRLGALYNLLDKKADKIKVWDRLAQLVQKMAMDAGATKDQAVLIKNTEALSVTNSPLSGFYTKGLDEHIARKVWRLKQEWLQKEYDDLIGDIKGLQDRAPFLRRTKNAVSQGIGQNRSLAEVEEELQAIVNEAKKQGRQDLAESKRRDTAEAERKKKGLSFWQDASPVIWPLKTKPFDLPFGTSREKAETELSKRLDHELTDKEKALLHGSLKWTDDKVEAASDEFLLMVQASAKAFPLQVRRMAAKQLRERYGVQIVQADKTPKAKKPKTAAELLKIIKPSSPKESARYAIVGFHVEPKGQLVVTDGRRLLVVDKPPVPHGIKPGLYRWTDPGRKGAVQYAEGEGRFPKWTDIVPDVENATHHFTIDDVGRVAANIRATEKAAVFDKKKDDISGVVIREPEGNVGSVNPQLLADGLEALHKLGAEKVEVFLDSSRELAPVLMIGKKGRSVLGRYVVMPIKGVPKTGQIEFDQMLLGVRKAEPKKAPKATGGKAGFPGTDSAARIGVSMEPKGKVTTAREIIDYAKRAFNITMRGKATHKMRTYAGWYDAHAVGIRLKDVRSLTTAMHEIGHYLDWHTNDRWSKKPGSKAIADELMAMGKALYADRKPPGGYKSEGWAEFTREYLTGEEAQQKAPNLYEWFTETYLEENPDVAKKLARTKKMISAWRFQGAEARVESQINRKPIKGTIWERITHRMLWLDTMFRDELAPLRVRLKQAGVKSLKPSDDPVALSVAFADKPAAKARHFVMEYTTDLAGNRNGKGLREILEPVRKDIKTFTRWIVAKRALWLWKRGINPGMMKGDVQYVYDKYKSDQWEQTATEITEWNHRLLDYLHESGAIETEALKKIKKLNPVYVPFMRAFAEGEVQKSSGTGKGIAKVGKAVKAIKGSGREIMDPFETMIQQAERIFSTAHKSMVARSLAKLATRKGMGSVIWKVPAPTKAMQFSAEQLKRDIIKIAHKRLGLDADVISSGMMEEWDEILTVYSNASQYYGKDNIVTLVVDGKRQFYEVDPDVYRVLEGLDQYSLPWFLSITFGKATRALRLGATGLNASFGLVRNFVRDAMTFTVLAKHAKAGPLSATAGVVKDVARTEAAQRFKAMGGKMSAQILHDRKATQNLRAEVVEPFVIRTALHPIDAMRELFGVTEAGVRIAEFDAALKDGEARFGAGSLDASIYALNQAQDVTTNFTRHGRIAKILNQLIPFFNAGIQGPDKILRTFRERPIRTTLTALAALTVPAILLWWRNKDEEWYKRLDPREKARYLHFRVPGTHTIVRIPIPFELGHWFQSIPVAALDAKYNDDPEEVKRIFTEAARDANPADWPALVGPVIDVMTNKDWAGNPIVTQSMARKLPEDQYKPWTTQLMRKVGKTLDVSPAKTEYVVNSYTGGLYGRAARTVELGINGPETPSDWPVIGTLFMREPHRPSKQIEAFYEQLENLSEKDASGKASGRERSQLKQLRFIQRKLSPYWKRLRAENITDAERKKVYAGIERWLKVAEKINKRMAGRTP